LRAAADALVIDTSDLTVQSAVARAIAAVELALKQPKAR
jgi:cytidylate kinase